MQDPAEALRADDGRSGAGAWAGAIYQLRLEAIADLLRGCGPGGGAMADVPMPSARNAINCLLVDDLDENLLVLRALLEPLRGRSS